MKDYLYKKWYDYKPTVGFLLVFFFPVGLYALWKSQTINQGWKIAWTILLPLFGIIAMSNKGNSLENRSEYEANKLGLQGLNLLQQEKYIESRICFIKASEIKGISKEHKSNYLRNAAVTYSESDMKDSAKFYYYQAAKLNQIDSYEYNVNLACVYLIDKDYTEAIMLLEKAYNINNSKLEANNTLGLIYLGNYDTTINKPEIALKYNKKAYEINKDRDTKFILAKNYYLISDYSNSEILFSELYKDYPNDINYLMYLILINKAQKDFAKAKIFLKELEAKDIDYYNYFNEIEN